MSSGFGSAKSWSSVSEPSWSSSEPSWSSGPSESESASESSSEPSSGSISGESLSESSVSGSGSEPSFSGSESGGSSEPSGGTSSGVSSESSSAWSSGGASGESSSQSSRESSESLPPWPPCTEEYFDDVGGAVLFDVEGLPPGVVCDAVQAYAFYATPPAFFAWFLCEQSGHAGCSISFELFIQVTCNDITGNWDVTVIAGYTASGTCANCPDELCCEQSWSITASVPASTFHGDGGYIVGTLLDFGVPPEFQPSSCVDQGASFDDLFINVSFYKP